MEKSLVIFCSSNSDINPNYQRAARELVLAACGKGYTIVSGGSWRGTMGVVSKAVSECGGRHRGVLPRFMRGFEYEGLTEVVWTDTMASRKERMREGTSAAIALPGGIGTMDELFETQVLSKLGRYGGRIFALNLDGFFEPLRALLDHFVAEGVTAREDVDRVRFCDTVEELAGLL